MQALGLLAWMATAGLTPAAAVAGAVAWRRGARRAAGWIGIGLIAWLVTYGAVLTAVSAASRERALARGETKRFCGVYLDCHLGVAVTGVRIADDLGPAAPRPAGRWWIVTVRVENGALRVPLSIHGPVARVRDAAGRVHPRSREAEAALSGADVDLGKRVPPGGSYTVRLVFDLPRDVVDPRLLVTEDGFPDRLAERFLIGDDDSFLHAPTTLRLS